MKNKTMPSGKLADLEFLREGDGFDLLYGVENLVDDVDDGAEVFANVENAVSSDSNDTIEGSGDDDTIDGGEGADLIRGNGGDDLLSGGAGSFDDVIYGGEGNDTAYGGWDASDGALDGADLIDGGGGADLIHGGGGGDLLIGGAGSFDDTIYGGDGDDTIYGGWNASEGGLDGHDTLYGGDGNDVIHGGGGHGGNYDRLYGGAGDDTLYGGDGPDILYGGSGNDVLDGNAGSDYPGHWNHLVGGEGGDVFELRPGTHVVDLESFSYDRVMWNGMHLNYARWSEKDGCYWFEDSATGEKLRLDLIGEAIKVTFPSADGYGEAWIEGNFEILNRETRYIPTLDITYEKLFMCVGTIVLSVDFDENSTYIGDDGQVHVYPRINDPLNSGTGEPPELPLVVAPPQGTDGDDVLVGGDAAEAIDGQAGNDQIAGGAGDDTLNGGLGADTLVGGAGNDQIAGGAGVDTVDYSSSTGGIGVDLYRQTPADDGMGGQDTLLNVENVIGSAYRDVIIGSQGDNRLEGGDGDDVLYGEGGDDVLAGGEGRDFLYGGLGVDVMAGGAGDDEYWVDDAGDMVVETAGEGAGDKVWSAIDYALGDHVEHLTLIGAAVRGAGNDLANYIAGNALANELYGHGGADTLDGGAGADALHGGAGNDVYRVDDLGDQTVELAGEGIDTVYANRDWTLAAHLENLILEGSGDLNGAGNELGNVMHGAGGANRLQGLNGDDTLLGYDGDDRLEGGSGADTLYGGAGADLFAVSGVGFGADLVKDFEIGVDRIEIAGRADVASFADVQAHISQVGADTVIDLGGGDLIRLWGVDAASLTAADFAFAP